MRTHLQPTSRVVVALFLSVPLLAGCIQTALDRDPNAPPAPAGNWSSDPGVQAPRLLLTLGDPAMSGLPDWTPAFDNIPLVYDVDGDGLAEILLHGKDGKVYVFSARTGRVLAALPTTYPPAWHIERILNHVQAAVLAPGDPPSLIITNHAAYVAVWRFDAPASRPEHFVFQKQWEHRMEACRRSPSMDAEATLGDLDGDGRLEIVVQTEEMGFFALRADGSTLWGRCWSGGNSAAVIDDLDGNGKVEVVVASDSGRVSVLEGSSGNPLWTFDATDPRYGINPGSVPVSPTVAEIDGRAPKEIVFTARHAPAQDATMFPSYHMAIFAVHQSQETWQAELLWMRQPEWANPMSNTRLLVRDVDGDGAAEIFGMDWNTIGHYPGDWERLGPAHAFRLDARGNDVWVREVDAWWSNKDIAVADSDGDGDMDVLLNGPGETGDGIWRLSAATGIAEGFLGTSPWKVLRGPLLAELSPGGATRLLLPVIPMVGHEGRGGVLLYELTPPAGP